MIRKLVTTLAMAATIIGANSVPANAQSSGNIQPVQEMHQQESTDERIIEETLQYGNSQALTVQWNQSTDVVEVFVDGIHSGTTTMSQLQEQYRQEMIAKGATTADPGIQARGMGCGASMLGLGTVNSLLWGVAGLAVPYPPAAAAALAGGTVTTLIIGVGGLFC